MDRDDFEFKPLTEGLGFHKKKSDVTRSKVTTTDSESSPFARPSSHMSSTTTSRHQNISFIEDDETEAVQSVKARSTPARPKGREIPVIEDEISPGNKAVDEILKTFKRNDLNFETPQAKTSIPTTAPVLKDSTASIKLELKSTKKAKEENKITFELEKTFPHLMANVLDTMLILAATMLCMIVLLTVTRIDLLSHITNPKSDPAIYYALVGLFFSVVLTYNLVTRVFMQATPGEWAFDIQLGTEDQERHWSYPLKVMARTLIYTATGFLPLVVISRLFKKDLVGSATSLSLHKKV